MAKTKMTFEQFQAGRVWSDNLIVSAPDSYSVDDYSAGDPLPRGWVYCGLLVIEEVQAHWPDKARARGHWYLILGNNEWIDNDLAMLERELYEYAASEGFLEASPPLPWASVEDHRDDTGDTPETDALSAALVALLEAEGFISGFEDDESQEGIPELLARIRTAITQAQKVFQ